MHGKTFPLLLLKKLTHYFTLLPNDNRMIDCFLMLWIHCFSCALDKMLTNNEYYNTLHNVLLYKSNKTICVFHEIFADNPDFSVRFRNCIFYAGNNFVVEETKHSSHKHLRVKTVNTFIWGKHQVVNPRRNNHFRCSPHMKEIIV